jgi:hypothetical protein
MSTPPAATLRQPALGPPARLSPPRHHSISAEPNTRCAVSPPPPLFTCVSVCLSIPCSVVRNTAEAHLWSYLLVRRQAVRTVEERIHRPHRRTQLHHVASSRRDGRLTFHTRPPPRPPRDLCRGACRGRWQPPPPLPPPPLRPSRTTLPTPASWGAAPSPVPAAPAAAPPTELPAPTQAPPGSPRRYYYYCPPAPTDRAC